MMKRIKAAAVLAFIALAPCTAVAGDSPCFADWSVAAPIVERERLVSVARLSDLVRDKLKAHIVKATLCRSESGYFFHVVIRPESGKLRTLTVNALQPFAE